MCDIEHLRLEVNLWGCDIPPSGRSEEREAMLDIKIAY